MLHRHQRAMPRPRERKISVHEKQITSNDENAIVAGNVHFWMELEDEQPSSRLAAGGATPAAAPLAGPARRRGA